MKYFAPDIKCIAVLRALKLGDLLCAVPAFRAIRAAFPESEITLIGLPSAAEFVDRYRHLIDKFAAFPGYPGLPEQKVVPAEVPQFFLHMQARKFDLALQMHGCGTFVNEVIALLGARQFCGFYEEPNWCPDPERFLPYPRKDPEIWRNLRLLQFLGIELMGDALEFPLYQPDYELLDGLPEVRSLGRKPYIVIHPGAISARPWPIKYFAWVGEALSSIGYQVVVTGLQNEAELCAALCENLKGATVNLCGRTSIGTLAALLARGQLLISHDTGIAHIEAALRLPSVIVFNGGDNEGRPPLDRQLHRFVSSVDEVSPELVLHEAADVLRIFGRPIWTPRLDSRNGHSPVTRALTERQHVSG